MAITNEDALKRLRNIVDYFILHNRRIYQRCDDSVVRVVDGLPKFLRRSRGYVPEPINLPFRSSNIVLGTGPELRVTGAVLLEDKCFLTQHIGDVEILETLDFLKESLLHMMKLTKVSKPDVIACDLHPLFLTTKLAKEFAEQWNVDVIKIQHHFAHMVKLLVEHNIPLGENVICIVADGVGYGLDGKPWGGEIFIGSYDWFERRGHLEPQPMPGGDLAAKYPARMVAGILSKVLSTEELKEILLNKCINGFKKGELELNIVLSQISKKINLTETTSAGRVLDAISALLGICFERTYEGEPAMRLESVAALGDPLKAKITTNIEQVGNTYIINTTNILLDVLEESKRIRKEHVAAAAQEALAKGLANAAINIAMEEGIKVIGFTGGVAYNEAITKTIRKEVERQGLKFISHRILPPGDGGISAGQTTAVAAEYR
jgi:hydrogenase maturation protein HypF